MRSRALRKLLLWIGVSLTLALPADAAGPVLHEFIPPDDGEDVALALTTVEGDLPAAIETRSGIVRAPDTQRPPGSAESAYREALSSSVPSVFRPDRDTRRPSVVKYDDPFSPSIAPYKRLRAYDLVGADYSLRVRDTALVPVPLGGEARPGFEEQFYADLTVDFDSSNTVLVPTVGPGARIVRLHATPQVAIEVWRDGAENWYAKATPAPHGRVHLVMQIAVPVGAFGGDLAMPDWGMLARLAPLPPGPARAFAKVEAALGLTRALSPAETVRKLVSYFRSFTPSEDPPKGHDDVYLDLALSQRGVCRHRAFAFLVTALGLGIPARMVINEAHAWVEVRGDRLWQRIDLGGAAGAIDDATSEARPTFRSPPDTFEWPATAETGSGQAAALRGRQSGVRSANASRLTSDMSDATSTATAAPSGTSAERTPPSPESPPTPQDSASSSGATDERPRPEIKLRGGDVHVHRGEPIHVGGVVEVGGSGCGQLRVDIALQRVDSSQKSPVGALATGANGAFEGNLYLPLSFPVGEYTIRVSTPGDARCGPASSR